MYLIDRAVAVVKLKQPFVNWVNSIEKPYGKLAVEKINRESHVYLLSEHATEQELKLIMPNLYYDIFEIEVQSFCRDKSMWPKNRDYKTFLEWFDIEVHSMVLDPHEDEIIKEEYFGG